MQMKALLVGQRAKIRIDALELSPSGQLGSLHQHRNCPPTGVLSPKLQSSHDLVSQTIGLLAPTFNLVSHPKQFEPALPDNEQNDVAPQELLLDPLGKIGSQSYRIQVANHGVPAKQAPTKSIADQSGIGFRVLSAIADEDTSHGCPHQPFSIHLTVL
jgi:hypothetical protein